MTGEVMAGVLSSAINSELSENYLRLTDGLDVDRFFVVEEIRVQMAWADALFEAKYLTSESCLRLKSALKEIESQCLNPEFAWDFRDGDIHLTVEKLLTAKLGELGKQIHLGRSRNDLVATTFRLWTASAMKGFQKKGAELAIQFADWALREGQLAIPAYTHLQAAQPIAAAQVVSAYAHFFERDAERLQWAAKRALGVCPLGSAAITGTHLKIDLVGLSKSLGFESAVRNSYDSVGDRDFVLDSAQAIQTLCLHLIRVANDFIVWSSTPFSLIKLPLSWSSGSSIMPNKRNPDAFEVLRAKAHRIVGKCQAITQGYCSVGSSYFSDFHEQKKLFFEVCLNLTESLEAWIEVVGLMQFDRTHAERLLSQGHLLATDLANQLVETGVPFRDAYKEVALRVKQAAQSSQQVHEGETGLTFQKSISVRSSSGGTAHAEVERQIVELRTRVQEFFDVS